MIQNKSKHQKMKSTYYLKAGQTLENTKVSDRSLALMLSKSALNHFRDYATENERLAAAAEKEAAELEALKKATYEMSKSWQDTVANVKKRRKEELLNRNKRDEEARAKFVEELKARNATERAEVVKEARKLLLWKKPQCRLINGALLTSECYRQLDAQIAFNKTLQNVDDERDEEYARMIREDNERAIEEEKIKAEEIVRRNRDYADQLKRQIRGIGTDVERLKLEELKHEKEDKQKMAKELKMIEECEAEQAAKRKKQLKQFFIEALEDKKLHEMEMKRNEEFEDRALEIYARSKDRIKKIGQMRMQRAMHERKRRLNLFSKTAGALDKAREAAEDESIRKAILEKEKLEKEKYEAAKKHDEQIRADMEKYKDELAAIKEHRANEERNMIAWETFQRLKRDEYNKEFQLEESKRQAKIKNENAHFLRKQMDEQEAKRKLEEIKENDSILIKQTIERTNEKVLAYGEEVLKECRELNECYPNGPKRPLFPIIKAIEQFKEESGLLPPKVYEESVPSRRRRRPKRQLCPKIVPPEEICYV